MDADPFTWDTADVQQFFRQHAIRYIADRPGAQLPPLGPFTQDLGKYDVYGPGLLENINEEVLRTQFGLTSNRQQNSVMYCIRQLRRQSKGYHVQIQGSPPQTPASLHDLQMMAATSQQSHAVPKEAGENKRTGEVDVYDKHGRKHRKLDITQMQTEKMISAAIVQTVPAGTNYLPNTKFTVEEMFYGSTKLGCEMSISPLGNEVLVDRDDDKAEDNFQFTRTSATQGQADFAVRRLHHFMTNAETVALRRRGKEALAILPSPVALSSHSRYAIVIQARQNGQGFVAVRERASLLQPDLDISGMVEGQESLSESGEKILEKWKHSEDDVELPLFGQSEDEYDEDDEATTVASDDSRELEAEEGDEESLSKARIADIIDEEIQAYVISWQQNQQPKLEERVAWSIWKKTKRSTVLRDALIQEARVKIDQLTSRSNSMRKVYLEDEWVSENQLRQSCHNIAPTIELREEEIWKIDVWQRRKEPPRFAKHRSSASHAGANKPVSGRTSVGFTVDPNDRLSVSPSSETRVGGHERSRRLNNNKVDGVVVGKHGPIPSWDPAVDDDGLIVSDNMLLYHMEPHMGPEPELDKGELSSRADADHLVNTCSHLQDREMSGTQRLRQHLLNTSSPTGSNMDDDLPSMSSFIPPSTVKAAAPNPSRSPHTSSQLQPIEISSDSPDRASSPQPRPKAKRGSRKGKATPKVSKLLLEPPEDATLAEVQSWDLDHLRRSNDRTRLLIKFLHEAGPIKRDRLHRCLLDLGSLDARMEQLSAALLTKTFADLGEPRPNPEMADIMPFAAELAMSWYSSGQEFDDRGAFLPWTQLHGDKAQLRMFLTQLMALLKRKKSKLFNGPVPTPSSEDVILIPSDEEDDIEPLTKHLKQRKRKVQLSHSAMVSRETARARHRKYTQVIESQEGLNSSQQLEATNAADTSRTSIIINPAKVEEDFEPIFIPPKISEQMKAHQIVGVRFMWREITAQEEDGVQGCLLAHTMGLGKTMQTIALLVAVVEASESDNNGIRRQLPKSLRPKNIRNQRKLRMLILCPPTLLSNWKREIDQWAPRGAGSMLGNIFVVEASSQAKRMVQFEDWYRVGGVLILGYSIFRSSLTPKKDHSTDDEIARLEEIVLEGAEIVIADEAHVLKNMSSGISQQAHRFATHTRIALTGTPMSNDVQEIYALISWVAPHFLGEPQEFRARFEEPIKAGQYFDSTRYEVRKSIMKLQVLHNEIEPKVDRADITALKGSLKPKVEFVITLPLMDLQKTIYRRYVNTLLEEAKNQKASQVAIFGWLGVLELLTNHPSAFRRKLLTKPKPRKNRKSESDATPAGDDSGSNAGNAITELFAEQQVDEEPTDVPGDEDIYELGFTDRQVQAILDTIEDDASPELSAKVTVLLKILQLSQDCGDQVLLFTHSLMTLDYLEDLLNNQGISHRRIDGAVQMARRLELIEDFAKNRFDVMLISTRAGGTGLNLQNANRVIIFDFSFNPSWEQQAVGRAYRFGQTKLVYVYRFVTGGTFEATLYNTQLFKTGLSSRVVDKKNPRRNAKKETREYLYEPREVKEEDLSQWIGKDPEVLDKLLLQHGPGEDGKTDTLMRSIQTMEVLQEEAQDEPLNEEERKEVDDEIKLGKTMKGRKKLFENYGVVGTQAAEPTGPIAIKGAAPPLSSLPGPSSQMAYSQNCDVNG